MNDQFIEFIKISDDLSSIFIKFKDNLTYKENKQKLINFLYHICFNLITQTEVSYNVPSYSINIVCDNGEKIYIKDSIKLVEKTEMTRSFTANSIYEKALNSKTSIEKNFIKYEKIFKILSNHNLIAQFMSLYQ